MLVSIREIHKGNRKREYKCYETSKDEKKKYKQKRSKSMNLTEKKMK